MSLKKILAGIIRADLDYALIQDNDYIAVGVSGGKDSMLLLKALKNYQKFKMKNFRFIGVFLDLGFNNVDVKTMRDFCDEIGVELHVQDSTEVYEILKHHKNASGNLPCSICSRMKKAAINKVAHEYGCNKVAFAHHLDDALETLLMNTIYGGRIATFAPKMHLTDTDLIFIRPFALVREKDIIATCKNENIPIIKSPCPNDHVTMREDAKKMLSELYKKYPMAYNNYQNMLSDYEHLDLWTNKKEFPIKGRFVIKEVIENNDLLKCLYIRQKVFVEEFNIPYNKEFTEDEITKDIHHYLITLDDNPVGTISYIKEGNKNYHLRRFALLPEYRKCGLGKEILKYVEMDLSSKENPITLKFTAMKYLQPFYEKMGYTPLEDLIINDIPHIQMIKTIPTAIKYKFNI